MKHDLLVEGQAFRLRPVALEDSAFILELRTDAELGRHLHRTDPDEERQRSWLRTYFDRPGDYYWIVEDLAGNPQGTVALYDLEAARGRAEWGRWILRRGSLAAPESAFLTLRTGFEVLRLQELFTRTRAANPAVVSFHTSIGARTVGTPVDDEGEPLVEQTVTRAAWETVRPALETAALQAGRLAARRRA